MGLLRSSVHREFGLGLNPRTGDVQPVALRLSKVLKLERVAQSHDLSGPASPPLRVETVMKIHGQGFKSVTTWVLVVVINVVVLTRSRGARLAKALVQACPC